MSGWRAPWSRTIPLTNRESVPIFCCIAIISTMCRSIGLPSSATHMTPSTTASVIFSARVSSSFVLREVRATPMRRSRSSSASSFFTLKSSRNAMAASRATSKPSVMTRGCRPSDAYRSACLSSSPHSRTVLVVPSPVTSSWAVAVRATRDAVGCWICISWRRTLPSFVSLIWPAPPTSILSVPRGPRLVFSTFWRPMAAETLTARAACFETISASGESSPSDDIFCCACKRSNILDQ
mmetsp:Transcript_23202/g.46306  ORF Transcript_23202/g.46306 Transcript_23202/m.46306 type:complete len:238 (-) Transcript_23202:102-815(-)